MNLELWPDDLNEESQDVHLHNISFEHFKPEAQAVLRLVGRGVFYRYGRDGYHAVHAPISDAIVADNPAPPAKSS